MPPKAKSAVFKRNRQSKFASLASDAGKPCPTCYHPMVRNGTAWACSTHGEPNRP